MTFVKLPWTRAHLALRVLSALVLIAATLISAHLVNRNDLAGLQNYNEYLNLTSAQSILVQRIAFLLGRLGSEESDVERQRVHQELTEAIAKLEKSLPLGQAKIRELNPNSYNDLLGKLHKYAHDARETATNITPGPQSESLSWLTRDALAEIGTFVDLLRNSAATMGAEAFERHREHQVIWSSLIIVALLGTGIFVLWPMLNTILQQHSQLVDTNNQIQMQNDQLKLSQGDLNQQKRILESVLESMGDSVLVFRTGGSLLLQNPAAERLIGKIESWKKWEDWHDQAGFWSAEDNLPLTLPNSPIALTLAGNSVDGYLLQIKNPLHPQGLFVAANGKLMRDEQGELQGCVLTFHEVTERVRYERDLKRAKAQAESANQLKSEFLANVSHEIRTPMTSILGYADQLLDSNQSAESRHNAVAIIQRNGKILIKLIDDILDISKIESGHLDLNAEKVRLPVLIAEIYSQMNCRAQEKKLQFTVKYQGLVPTEIQTDPNRLRQILLNLVGNAIKFTESGQVNLTISYQPAEQPGFSKLYFSVSDSGCGISPDSVDRLFRPFVQLDTSSSRRYGGTGLGLALSKRFVTLLGGELTLQSSTVGVGSVFSFYINPGSIANQELVNDLTVTGFALPGDRSFSLPQTGLETISVLLVEDSPENRELFCYYLETAGAKVTTANEGKSGVAKALEGVFDIVLMDIQMPQMDGYSAVSLLKSKCFQPPVIALTAHAMKEDRDRCLAAGFDGYLVKPIFAAGLIAEIRRHLKNPAIAMPPRIRKIIKAFIDNVPTRLQAMQKAWDQNDINELSALIHQFKGTSGSCGLSPLRQAAEVLEKQVQTAPLPEFVAPLLVNLEGIARQVKVDWEKMQ